MPSSHSEKIKVDDNFKAEFCNDKKLKTSQDDLIIETSLLDVYSRKYIRGDGNCLFRAVLYCLFEDYQDHYDLCQECCDYMLLHRDNFEEYMWLQRIFFLKILLMICGNGKNGEMSLKLLLQVNYKCLILIMFDLIKLTCNNFNFNISSDLFHT